MFFFSQNKYTKFSKSINQKAFFYALVDILYGFQFFTFIILK